MSTIDPACGASATPTADLSAVILPSGGVNAFEDAVSRLMHVIKLGIVAEGERLPSQRDLAEMLNISRVTLREAIRALQLAGFVNTRRGRTGGTFVTYKPEKQGVGNVRRLARDMGGTLVDALTFRQVIEPGAAALAARRAQDPESVDNLRRLAERARKAESSLYRMADSRLHLAIAEMSGSQTLASAVADIQLKLNDLLSAIPLMSSAVAHSHDQHDAIVDAIAAQDAQLASDLMLDHIAGTAALLEGFLS